MTATGNIFVLAKFAGRGNGMTERQAIRAANERRVVLLSNKLLDERVTGSDVWKGEWDAYPSWTGTLVACKKPGEKLGKEIVSINYKTSERHIFPVRSDFQGEKGLLAVEHGFIGGRPTFDIVQDGKDFAYVISPEAKVLLETRFPSDIGWYATNELGIPVGGQVSRDFPGARYLIPSRDYAGLLARGQLGVGDDWKFSITVRWLSSDRLGALAVENPATTAGEKR